ncbi:MAG: exo-alpha-sialidase, partial [Kiritimatiellae bacterium]|nr:exo-alpha-sialidase [Kiritimatiellia bacterium]
AKKIFLFYNVWECVKQHGVYQFYVQESCDNGLTWSKPRDISKDIAFPGWPFGAKNGFIFLTSGSGTQTKDGTLLHTVVHVGDGNALFGSEDHGKTWKAFGSPVRCGDECKVVELSDGSWMINSRWRGGGRQIHVTKDRGRTWESRYDAALTDPQCNAQIMRYPLACARPGKTLKPGMPESVLVFSNCNASGRRNLFVRTSWDDGATWTEGVCVEPAGAAYSDMTILPGGKLGVLFEGAGYSTIRFCTLEPREFLAR